MKDVNIMGFHQFLGEGGHKKYIYMGNCLKRGLGHIAGGLANNRGCFWGGWYLDTHRDLILVHAGT